MDFKASSDFDKAACSEELNWTEPYSVHVEVAPSEVRVRTLMRSLWSNVCAYMKPTNVNNAKDNFMVI